MKKLLTILLLGVLFLSCGKNEGEKTSKENGKTENTATESKETLVASTAPLKWLVQKIAGNNYDVIAIVPPNANHELFEPKPDDLKKLENSKLFFTYNLLGFEKKISESLNNSDKTVMSSVLLTLHCFLKDITIIMKMKKKSMNITKTRINMMTMMNTTNMGK